MATKKQSMTRKSDLADKKRTKKSAKPRSTPKPRTFRQHYKDIEDLSKR